MKNEQAKMAAIAAYLSVQTGLNFVARYIYIDLGADIMDWTVLSNNEDKFDYQLLSRREINEVKEGTFTFAEMELLAQEINQRGY